MAIALRPTTSQIDLSDYGRLLPGALAAAAAGLDQKVLLTPAPALALLAIYAAVAAGCGWFVMARRDVA